MASPFLLVSYVPFLRGTAGQLLDLSGSSELFAALARVPLGTAGACLWLESGGAPYPVLVFDQAEAIADHLVEWAEGNPSAWFRVTLLEHRGHYGVVLLPDIAASLDRFLRARGLNGHERPPDDTQYAVVSTPLHFTSGLEHLYQQVRPRFSDRMSLGLLEGSALDLARPEVVDPGRVRMLGPFQVGGDPMAEDFLRKRIEAAVQEEP